MGLFSKDSKKPKYTSPAAPPPPPPPPPPPRSLAGPSSRPQQSASQAQPILQWPEGSLAVGVETEFLVESRNQARTCRATIEDFSRQVAAGYKQFMSARPGETHPDMHNAINESFRGERYSQWSVDSDSTIVVPRPGSEPWGLELISPILRAHPNSAWRSHIARLWTYLERNYFISANSSCGTHVHMSVAGGYTLIDLKRIASSVLHFEPAFEALLPKDRLRNEYTKSNWIDNKNFAYRNVSREAAIAQIQKCDNPRALILLMNPDNDGERDKMFGWNFLNLLQSTKSTIEFRRGAPSTNADQLFMWVEVAMSFLKASMVLGTPENLSRVPATAGGLKSFISYAKLPRDVFMPQYLGPFFSGVADNAALQPLPVGKLSKEKLDKLKRKKMEDKQRSIMLEKTLKAPYWD